MGSNTIQKKRKNDTEKGKVRPNPVGSTSESLFSYLARLHGDQNDTILTTHENGVFVPDFDPLDFEHRVTVLNPGIRVLTGPKPDIRILAPEMESEREYSRFDSPKNGNLPVVSIGGTAYEQG